MQPWIERRSSLEEFLQKKKDTGTITPGQERSLTTLIFNIKTAEQLGKLPRNREIIPQITGLLVGQHLEDQVLVTMLRGLRPNRGKK